jgi:hypothetical protein
LKKVPSCWAAGARLPFPPRYLRFCCHPKLYFLCSSFFYLFCISTWRCNFWKVHCLTSKGKAYHWKLWKVQLYVKPIHSFIKATVCGVGTGSQPLCCEWALASSVVFAQPCARVYFSFSSKPHWQDSCSCAVCILSEGRKREMESRKGSEKKQDNDMYESFIQSSSTA